MNIHNLSNSDRYFNNETWERSGKVLDSRLRGCGFEPHRRHCVVVLEQDTFSLALYWFNQGGAITVILKEW